MSCKGIATQSELDGALADDGVTCVHIKSERGVWLAIGDSRSKTVEAYGSASVRAYGSASVRASGSASVEASGSASVRASGSASVRAYDSASVQAYDSASVQAYDSASVEASGSASVEASGSASVEAYGSASVEAYGSASVQAYGSASVQASGSASVEASGSASVQAYGSASVRAYGSASVRAYGSASVEAYGSASVRASGSASVRASGSASVRASGSASVEAYGSASVRAWERSTISAGPHVAVHLHEATATVSGGVLIDMSALNLEDGPTWAAHHGAEVVDGRVTLYKALSDNLITGQGRAREFVWNVGTELEAPDWRDDHECGGGLHLSPTPHMARDYAPEATRYVRCSADLADVRPIVGGTPKCKVRALRVEVEVDVFARTLEVTV